MKKNKILRSLNSRFLFNFVLTFAFSISFFVPKSTLAFKNNALLVGLGYYSENFLNKTSQKADSSAGLLGETNYPLNVLYSRTLVSNWYVAPQLSYTLLPRSDPGSTAKVTLTHLVFQFGQNIGLSSGDGWDWYFGPGYLQHQYQGSGGTTVMNNGTGTATFAKPGATNTATKITTNLGTSYNTGPSRIGIDLVIENAMSSSKRTQSLMLSYAYQVSGGLF